MEQTEISRLLVSFGFKGLVLTDLEGANFTYKFEEYKPQVLKKNFGEPSLTASGKVAIFIIPSYGKLGVSPGSRRVRLSYTGSHAKREVDDSHLAKVATSKEIQVMYERAKASPAHRVQFLDSLWEFFNATKFGDRLPKPKFLLSEAPKIKLGKNTRGYYQAGRTLGAPGVLWVSNRLFNASEHFFNEVFLHEMCHQAVWCIDRVLDAADGGHGSLWQTWMRKVGLDPRRYDPTEDSVYSDDVTRAVKDEKDTANYGPRSTVSEIKRLTPVGAPVGGPMFTVYEGRIFKGAFTSVGKKYTFRGTNVKGGKPITLTYKGRPSTGLYTE